MFDPIEAPDVHRGPAVGHSTEFGTTWQEAVSRINAGFKALFERGKTEIEPAAGVTKEFVAAVTARFEAAEAKVAFLEEALSDALFKIDNHATMLTAMTTPADSPPATPVPSTNTDAPTA
jgi:hypothetical protein